MWRAGKAFADLDDGQLIKTRTVDGSAVDIGPSEGFLQIWRLASVMKVQSAVLLGCV